MRHIDRFYPLFFVFKNDKKAGHIVQKAEKWYQEKSSIARKKAVILIPLYFMVHTVLTISLLHLVRKQTITHIIIKTYTVKRENNV